LGSQNALEKFEAKSLIKIFEENQSRAPATQLFPDLSRQSGRKNNLAGSSQNSGLEKPRFWP
jgi:hypothetical protein